MTKFYDVRGPLGFELFGEHLVQVIEYTKDSPFSVSSRTVGYFILREEAEEWVNAHCS